MPDSKQFFTMIHRVGFVILIASFLLVEVPSANGDLVAFFDNTTGQISGEAFPNTHSGNGGASAAFTTLGSNTAFFDQERSIQEISYIFPIEADLISWRFGLVNNPFSYDAITHGTRGVGGYSVVAQETQRFAPDMIEEMGTVNGIDYKKYIFTGFDMNLGAGEGSYLVLVADLGDGAILSSVALSGDLHDSLGQWNLAGPNTGLIREFGFLSGDHGDPMVAVRGMVVGVPEPTSLTLLGMFGCMAFAHRRDR